MPSEFILALDQGTTSSRTIIFDHKGNIVSVAHKEFRQIFPKPGWVEHDPEEIWSTQYGTIAEALAKAGITLKQIVAIGITNQRETTVVWNRETGKPVYNAIVWQDRRTAGFCDELIKSGHQKTISEKTGLVIDAYFSASKIKWILDNVSGARKDGENGKLAFGTIDTWLIWKLTGGKVHVTDVSNASRTMLLNINKVSWDDDLLKLFRIPVSMLPEVKPSSYKYGQTGNIVPGSNIPIAGIAGDQQAALFGQLCVSPGMVKNTYGTGCFMLMNTGDKPMISNNNLVTTIAWQLGSRIEYALEGSVFIAGAVVQWLRDGLHFIRNSSEIEKLASQVEDNGGVYMVPAFAGLGAPHWNQHARGAIYGLTRGTTHAHLARAALESIAFQTADVLKAMQADSGLTITELRVDGGATVNDGLMQFQSDLLNCKVVRPRVTETTALGAAYFAGLATGFWKDVEEIRKQWQIDKEFLPSMAEQARMELSKGWQKAIASTITWTNQ